MAASTCSTCIVSLRIRLHSRLSYLGSLRSRSQVRSYKVTPETSNLAYHWDTVPPTPAQLRFATDFIETHRPRKIWAAGQWRKPSDGADGAQLIPEVAFLGRANVGKSSLLNALLQAPGLASVGSRPGKTKTMRAWGLSASDPLTGGAGPGGERDVRLAVLDMPGYGFQSQAEWGNEILTYLRRRKQLKRVFLLINALHGFKPTDRQMISMLRDEGISCQVIASKVDRLLATSTLAGQERLQEFFESVRREIVQLEGRKGVAPLGEILAVGNLGDYKEGVEVRELDKLGMLGIEQVRWAVLVAAGVEEWVTKRSGTTSDKGRSMGSTKKTSQDLLRRLPSHSAIPQPPTPTHDSASPMPSVTLTDEEKRILKIPFLSKEERRITKIVPLDTPTDTSHISEGSLPDDATSRMEAVFAPPKKGRRGTSNTPSWPPSRAQEYNPVGGLAELEALSSPKNRSSSNHKSTFNHGGGPSRFEKREKGKKGREQNRWDVRGRVKNRKHHMSDKLIKTIKEEKDKKIMMKRATRAARDDDQPLPPYRDTTSTRTARNDSWSPNPRGQSNGGGSSRQPPLPPPPPPSPSMGRGIGVGNIDDLLRATNDRRANQGGTGSRPRRKRGPKGPGACKRAAKQKWLDKPGFKGW